MLIKAGFDISYDVTAPTPMVLMLYIHPSRHGDIRKRERLVVEPQVPVEEFFDNFGNRCARILAPAGTVRFTSEALVTDTGEGDPYHPDAYPASRAGSADVRTALICWQAATARWIGSAASPGIFRAHPAGWGRVQAVCDWVHKHVNLVTSSPGPIKARTTSGWKAGRLPGFQHLS